MSKSFNGVFSLLLTPFRDDFGVDWESYEQYVEWQVGSGPDGLFAVCGTSEMKWLTHGERIKLAKRAVAFAKGTPVVATANLKFDRSSHADEIRAMADAGVDGVVLVPPDGLGNDQTALLRYFSVLADTSPIPVFIYEWPEMVSHILSPETFETLSKNHGVKGIKDTTCTLSGICEKIRKASPNTIVYQANAAYLLDALAAGAKGVMAIVSAACPDLVVEFWKLAKQKDPKAADAHQILVFYDALLRFGYPTAAKYLLQLRGLQFPTLTRARVNFPEEGRRVTEMFYNAYLRN